MSRAERPVLYVGMGVRLADAFRDFEQLVDRLNIPVVTGMSSVDFMPINHPLYAGHAVQLVIALAILRCRIATRYWLSVIA